MLSLFNRVLSLPKEAEQAKIHKNLLRFIDSPTLVSTLPLVNHSLKSALETTYADLRAAAAERVLIYKKTLKPSQFFSRETADSFAYKRLSGGYTNCTFELRLQPNAAYISRIPGTGSELFIDRAAEFYNAQLANKNHSTAESEFTQWANEALKSCLSLIKKPEFVAAVTNLENETKKEQAIKFQ